MAEKYSSNHEKPSGSNAPTDTLGSVGNQRGTFQTYDPRLLNNMHDGFDPTLALDFYTKYKRYINPSSEDSDPDFPPSQRYKKYTDRGMGMTVPVELTRPPSLKKRTTVLTRDPKMTKTSTSRSIDTLG